jgi:hypothetical protein
MISKTMIGFILASTMVSSALIFDGVAHRHYQNNNQPATPQMAATNTAPSANPSTPDSTTPATNDTTTPEQPATNDATTPEQQAAAPTDDSATNTVAIQRPARVRAAAKQQTEGDAPAAPPAQPAVAAAAEVADQPVAPAPIVVPAGTPLTLRLSEPLGSSMSEIDQSFSASLDSDVVVDGQTVIAAGAPVMGRVVFARPAGLLAGEANLQLQLTSVNVNHENLTVVTSVRSFGPRIKGKTKVSRFMKGLVRRVDGEEREVRLAEQSAYTFTLRQPLEIQ